MPDYHKDWGHSHQSETLGPQRTAYAVVGEEYGVGPQVVRDVCGTIGTMTTAQVSLDERIAVLRRKMEMANYNRLVVATPEPEEEPEMRELRTCVLCENLLEDDDPGQDVVNGEDVTKHAVICLPCRRDNSRF